MKVIPREARKITNSNSRELRELRKTLSLNQQQYSIIIGAILGDGYLEPNQAQTNYRLKIQHSIHQKAYVLWKHKMLGDWVLSAPHEQLVNRSLRFRTVSHPAITHLRSIFYRDAKKIVPNNIVNYLDALVLAVWFMDDGNALKWKEKITGYHINTQSFSEDEHRILIHALKSKFCLDAVIQNNNGYKRLYIRAKDRDAFRSIIIPYVLPSMRYKLD